MVKISIIVPVYNTGKYVGKCIESLLQQTLNEIEIICIDDASTDNSLLIIDSYAQKDDRLCILKHIQNQGTLQARKHGVEQAAGKYIMFVDSDDWLEKAACEKLYNHMQEKQTDILQFGTNVIPAVPLSESLISWIENFLKPYNQKIDHDYILRACFIEDRFDFNITDKIWKTTLCKTAFKNIKNQRMIAAEDRYAFFILAYYANDYTGLNNAKYYNYNVGIGITGSDLLDLERFEKRCTGVKAANAVYEFLEENNALEEYQEEYKQFRNKILWDCVDCWYHKLNQRDQGVGYDILLKYWEADEIISSIARMYFEDISTVSEKIMTANVMTHKPVIGIYYRYLGYELMDEYVQRQVNAIKQSDYSFCLFSDIDAPANNWENSELVLLPSSKEANWDKYEERAVAFKNQLKKHNISVMLYASPTSHIAWLDTLLLKSMGILVLYLDEDGELEKRNYDYSKMQNYEKKIQEITDCCEKIKESKAYKLGSALLWFPKKVRKMF
ncbi:glycosyltransferase family 2 protein [Clostridium sp. AM58-1XD]|uniref:glycosyltransferase family 2 protein n=1 Tax=Clostridium sp. AM58-1XD TaxID=2292307 RepID=UPI000E50CAE3|nr:glycosyltransferase family 2 protein [Clostridium sp. AM58-1XD]RGY94641.1 glycosyltransferase family 2 protein [Clostridium sp. AM58-1XD]